MCVVLPDRRRYDQGRVEGEATGYSIWCGACPRTVWLDRDVLFLRLRLQGATWNERHGSRSVIAGATSREIRNIENSVGWKDVIAAGTAKVPQGLEFHRVQVDIGGLALVSRSDHVGAGTQWRTTAPEPAYFLGKPDAASQLVHGEVVRTTDQ